MTDYRKKLEKLKNRRQDNISKAFSLSESFGKKTYGESTTYALEAMEAINEEYTKNTYKACERIQNQLKPGLKEYGIEVEFKYQGSVPTNTHIKLYSDADVLTIYQGFFTLQSPQTPQFPYEGDPVEDLKNMRKKIFRILDTVYPAAEIDDTGSKALSICGGSLNRRVDIISANWYNSNKYVETNDPDYRGVNILDRDKDTRILNYPFMHIYWINEKDIRVNGNEKRLIRLLKTLKADADEKISISSYDISSLVYRMEDNDLIASKWERLRLLQNCSNFLKKIIDNASFRDSLLVTTGLRKIFSPEGAKIEEVVKLYNELKNLVFDIASEIKPLYENIEKANISY